MSFGWSDESKMIEVNDRGKFHYVYVRVYEDKWRSMTNEKYLTEMIQD